MTIEKLLAGMGLILFGGVIALTGDTILFRNERVPRFWGPEARLKPLASPLLQQTAVEAMPALTCHDYVAHGGWEKLVQDLQVNPDRLSDLDRDRDGRPCEDQFSPELFQLEPIGVNP